jgi:hypothetical protein
VALAAHDEVLRKAIQTHGVCVAFALPRCAVDAAVAAQRALALPVRTGIVRTARGRLAALYT